MGSVAIGIFDSRDQAERTVQELRSKGFDREISVVTKETGRGEAYGDRAPGLSMNRETDTNMDGITTGGVLGSIAGLAVGAGALVIPGIGPLIAAGPIAGLLSGAAVGGIAGGLIDWGVPADVSRRFEEDVKQGKTLVSVHASSPKLDDAANILRRHGANDVNIW
jgi:hypothetical protein